VKSLYPEVEVTKLLSNVIKSRYIYLNNDNKKIIDSNELSERFRILNLNCQVNDKKINSSTLGGKAAVEEDGFTEGLNVTLVNPDTTSEQDELLKLKEEHILQKAREEADRIIEEAKQTAQGNVNTIYEEAKNKGYQDGFQKAMEEVSKKKNELEALIEKHNQEYLNKLNEMEPEIAELVAMLVSKMTGILAENNKNVIHYLIQNAIQNADNSNSFVIRVSEEDFEFLLSKKVELESLVKENTFIDIVPDKELKKNQCFIEADSCIIDCSLDTQLNNLVQDLKLLSIDTKQPS
jgi:flagellar assembly protein FliH